MSEPGNLRIGEVAERAGVPASTIRFYEREGVLPAPHRTNGQRRYDADTVGALAVVDLAQQAGFTLDEIRTLLYGFSDDTPPPARWRALARAKLPEVEERLGQLEAMKALLEEGLQCDCLRLDDCGVLLSRSSSAR